MIINRRSKLVRDVFLDRSFTMPEGPTSARGRGAVVIGDQAGAPGMSGYGTIANPTLVPAVRISC